MPLLGEKKDASPELKETEQRKILANPELQTSFSKLRSVLKIGQQIKNNPQAWWQNEQAKIKEALIAKKRQVEEKLNTLPDKARAGALKNLEKLKEQIAIISSLTISQSITEVGAATFMEKLNGITEAKEALHAFSAFHLTQVIPEGFRDTMEKLCNSADEATVENISLMADLLLQYLREHYLHVNQTEHITYHSPFSKELRKTLEGLWQMTGDINKHIIVLSAQKLQSLTAAEKEITMKTQEISFVPARGLLRVFSGDIGDSCYTSRHMELAKGQYPDLTAVVIVTNRGKTQERIMGSFLLIETKTSDGRGVLLIRANNPRENLLGKVDVGSLIREIITYTSEIAEKRGLNLVVVPLDEATASSSNRPAVSEFYYRSFSQRPKIDLVNQPETNFNDYNNWDSKGYHPVVAVWERESNK